MDSLTPFLVTNALFGTIMLALRVRSRRLRASVMDQENGILAASIAGTQQEQEQRPQPPGRDVRPSLDDREGEDPETSHFVHVFDDSKPDAWITVPST